MQKNAQSVPVGIKPCINALTAATRGTLSTRAWVDLRQAARLANSEGVGFFMHGVVVRLQEKCVGGRPRRAAAFLSCDRGCDEDDRARRVRAAADGTRRRRRAVEAAAAQRAAPQGQATTVQLYGTSKRRCAQPRVRCAGGR